MNIIRKIFILSLISLGALAGGIDGGGGTTLPQNPIAERDVIWTAEREAKGILRGYVRYLETTGNPISYPNGANLFSGSETLIDAVENTSIVYNKDGPCKDSQGNDVDGSIHLGEENTICLSSETIRPKLSYQTKDAQIAALILHELGHVFGLSEDEADELQWSLIWWSDIAGAAYYDGIGELPSSFLDNLSEDISQYTERETLIILRNLLQMSKMISLRNQRSSLLDMRQTSYFNYQIAKLELMYLYANSQANVSGSIEALNKYNIYFKNGNQVNLDEVVSGEAGKAYGKCPINKLNNTVDVQAQLAEINKYFKNYFAYWKSFWSGEQLAMLEDPLRPAVDNPWKQYKGSYKKIGWSCAGEVSNKPEVEQHIESMDDIEIKETPNEVNKFSMFYTTAFGGIIEENLFSGGSGKLMYFGSTRVRESAGAAYRHREDGGGWSSRYQDTFKMKKTNSNKFLLERSYKIHETSNDGIDSEEFSCQFILEKIN